MASISGVGCLGALGSSLGAHCSALAGNSDFLKMLVEMSDGPSGFDDVRAGWIADRSLLSHRKWSPLSMAALHVAKEAIQDAGWTSSELRDATVFFGTSRGSLAGWLEPWPGRRSFRLMAASNTLASEPAAAVSGELGIGGPWQVVSTGCCAGLDALSTARLWIEAGKTQRAIVIAADLPLVAPVIQAYADTGILARGTGPGLIPAEAAACVCLEAETHADRPQLLACEEAVDSDAMLSSGKTPVAISRLLQDAITSHGPPSVLVAHSSGTQANAAIEKEAIRESLGPECAVTEFKSRTGHGIGASGLLELGLIIGLSRSKQKGVTQPDKPFHGLAFKLASALGGRHSLAVISLPL